MLAKAGLVLDKIYLGDLWYKAASVISVFAFMTVLSSVTVSITKSLCRHRLFCRFAADSLLAYSTSVLIITPSIRVIGHFSSFCLVIWRKVGWFGWSEQRCYSGRAVLASAKGHRPVSEWYRKEKGPSGPGSTVSYRGPRFILACRNGLFPVLLQG